MYVKPSVRPSYWLSFLGMACRSTYEIRHFVLQCHQKRTKRRLGYIAVVSHLIAM
ncbi:hypothetical protein BDV26DRAFT_273283 [Aspergillus bertholletiae]|uniref:Uncharacterized protein n=1 Tax=Aspergillus bertholletiae TaxID=1226010 RepID=A0A5N7ASN4_9EURO|nr:hypothetical protein BDV26DRAFT_273283 [Aspergillus bertholletiae]